MLNERLGKNLALFRFEDAMQCLDNETTEDEGALIIALSVVFANSGVEGQMGIIVQKALESIGVKAY